MFENYLLLSLVCVFQLAAKRPNWELTTFVIIPINLEDMFEKGDLGRTGEPNISQSKQ